MNNEAPGPDDAPRSALLGALVTACFKSSGIAAYVSAA